MTTEMKKLLKQFERIADKICKLRDECPHDSVIAKYRGDSGNYDPNDNTYWVEVNCDDCGKYFSVYENKDPEGYRKWGDRV